MTDPDFRIVECFGAGEPTCRLYGTCVLTTTINEAMEAFLEVPDGYTLADLIRPKRSLRHPLHLAPPPTSSNPASPRPASPCPPTNTNAYHIFFWINGAPSYQ